MATANPGNNQQLRPKKILLTEATQTPNDHPKVVIVVPTYNEIDNLPILFDRLSKLGIPGMLLLVVDDNSPDGTGELADRLATENPGRIEALHRTTKSGIGKAYVHGLGHALELGADLIVQIDADLSHPPECVPEMLERLQRVDVVTASRYAPGGGVDPDWSLGRKLISRLGSLGIRLVLGLRVRDATSGFKAYRRRALEKLGLESLKLAGFGFQSEVAYRCEKAGLRVAEYPYVFMERGKGKSKMSMGIVIEAFARLTWLRLRG